MGNSFSGEDKTRKSKEICNEDIEIDEIEKEHKILEKRKTPKKKNRKNKSVKRVRF